MRLGIYISAFAVIAISACSDAPPIGAKTAQVVQPSPEQELAPLPAPDPKLARVPLGERLSMEAEARPALAVRPEQLDEALRARGVTIARKRQVLASTLGAAYCELAVSNEGLAVSLCEYADAAAAELGGKHSHRMFDRLMPGRSLATRDNVLLTVTQGAGLAAEQQAALVLEVFAEQRPTALPTKTALVH